MSAVPSQQPSSPAPLHLPKGPQGLGRGQSWAGSPQWRWQRLPCSEEAPAPPAEQPVGNKPPARAPCLDTGPSREPGPAQRGARCLVTSRLRCLRWHEEPGGRGRQLFYPGRWTGRGGWGQGGSRPVGLHPRHKDPSPGPRGERAVTLMRAVWAKESEGREARPTPPRPRLRLAKAVVGSPPPAPARMRAHTTAHLPFLRACASPPPPPHPRAQNGLPGCLLSP